MALRKPFTGYQETEKEIIVKLKIPEDLRDHLIVKTTRDRLFIQIDKKQTRDFFEEGYLKEEEVFTSLSKEILLPSEIIPNKTKTEYKEGILQVILRKL